MASRGVRLVHLAQVIDGHPRPICYGSHRILDPRKGNWTRRAEAVTCAKCRHILRRQQQATKGTS
jgi:hypothetical protein